MLVSGGQNKLKLNPSNMKLLMKFEALMLSLEGEVQTLKDLLWFEDPPGFSSTARWAGRDCSQ